MTSLLGVLGFTQKIWGFVECLPEFLFNLLIMIVFVPLYLVFMGISSVSLFAETAFKKLAGIDTIYLNGQGFSGGTGDGTDLVYAFITDQSVQNVFWSVLALSIVLLFILTIVALIKSEFTLDTKGNAKGPIIGRALKSLANFLIVPVATLISIIGVNFITTSVYKMFNYKDSTVVTKCFYLGAYQANRVRRGDTDFFISLLNGDYLESGTNPFTDGDREVVAQKIDNAFVGFETLNLEFKEYAFSDMIEAKANDTYVPFQTMLLEPESSKADFTIWQVGKVNYFYNLFYFDYILALGSAIVMAWTLLSVCLVLVKRVFELTILFLLSPVMTAIAPLDGGQAEKKWRQEFMKRVLAVVGPIFAYNMFFLLIPLFESISLFGENGFICISALAGSNSTMLGTIASTIADFAIVFDVFFQIVCILVGLSVVKSASALLSSLLGIDDLIKSGAEATKKAVDTGKKVALGATAIGGVAVKGAAFVVKGVGKGVKGAFNKEGKLQRKEDNAKEKLDKATKEAEKRGTLGAGGMDDENIAALQKDYDEAKNNNLAYTSKKFDTTLDKAGSQFDKKKEKIKKKLDEAKKNNQRPENALEDWKPSQFGLDEEARLQKEYNDLGGDDANKTQEIKNKVLDTSREKLGAKVKAARNQPSSIWGGIKQAYDEEYGEDSGKMNLAGSMSQATFDKFEKSKFRKIPILGARVSKTLKSANDYFNISGETATRRLNDALGGLFGDGGGKDLWEINFKRNARDALFMGVPEKAGREQDVQQSMLVAARNRYDESEKLKKQKDEELKNFAKYIAKEMHNPEYDKKVADRDKAEERGDFGKVAKLDAELAKMEVDMGATKQAREGLSKSYSDEKYQKFKSEVKDEATDKALEKEAKEKQYLEGRKLNVEAKIGNEYLKTKQSPEDIQNMAKYMAQRIAEAMSKGVKFDQNSLESLAKTITDGTKASQADFVKQIQEALAAINKK